MDWNENETPFDDLPDAAEIEEAAPADPQEDNIERPGYYAVIPASVRYDKSLPPNAKLLYGEISALANKHGFCFARNKYFAELYGVHPPRVSEWIKALVDAGHIRTEVIQAQGNRRKIYITPTSPPDSGKRKIPPIKQNRKTSSEKSEDPSSEKGEDLSNTPSINNTTREETYNVDPSRYRETSKTSEPESAPPVENKKPEWEKIFSDFLDIHRIYNDQARPFTDEEKRLCHDLIKRVNSLPVVKRSWEAYVREKPDKRFLFFIPDKGRKLQPPPPEIPPGVCADCGNEVLVQNMLDLKNDRSHMICQPCFRRRRDAEQARSDLKAV